jgi:hypothetical protein
MSDFISTGPKYVVGHFFTRLFGVVFFIASIGAYAYATQFLLVALINTLPEDPLLYIFAGALLVCWFGSLILIGKWFRYYHKYRTGFGSLILSLLPLFIIPLAWGAYELIKIVEVYFQ